MLPKNILKCDPDRNLKLAQQRFCRMMDSQWCMSELLDCEEATQALDRDDQRAVCAFQNQSRNSIEHRNVYLRDWALKKQTRIRQQAGLPADAPVPAPKEVTDRKYPAKLPLAWTQEKVKEFAPPTVSVWRGNVKREWWAHVKPF